MGSSAVGCEGQGEQGNGAVAQGDRRRLCCISLTLLRDWRGLLLALTWKDDPDGHAIDAEMFVSASGR